MGIRRRADGDHYAGAGKNPNLFVCARDRPSTLGRSGFCEVMKFLDLGGMALHRANREILPTGLNP
jgi:hypothetical protein